MKNDLIGDDMGAVVKRYDELTVLDTETHFSIEGKVSTRARKYLRFIEFLMKFGTLNETGAIMFPKRFAMAFVGEGDRQDLYAVNRVLEEIRKLTFVWRSKIPDGTSEGDEIVLRGNPMTFTVSAEKRGYAGVKFDRDYLAMVRDPSRSQIETMFAYTFLLAEADFAYEHVQLFSKIWSAEAAHNTTLEEVAATVEISAYRHAVKGQDVHPDFKNFVRCVTKPAVGVCNERTKFNVSYKLVSLDETKGKTRSKATHIEFRIVLKASYQLEMNFDGGRLETLDQYMDEVVDFDELKTVGRGKSILLPPTPTTVEEYTTGNEKLLGACQKLKGLGVPESDLMAALERWQPIGVIETLEAFETRVANTKADPIANKKAYLISLLRSGKARKTSEQRQQERAVKEQEKIRKAKASPTIKKQQRYDHLKYVRDQVLRADIKAFNDAMPQWEKSLSDEQRNALFNSILASSGLARPAVEAGLNKGGVLNAAAKIYAKPVIRKQFPDAWKDIRVTAQNCGVGDWDALTAEFENLDNDPEISS